MAQHNLKIPLSEDKVIALRAGDFFTVTGTVCTCRPLAYERLLTSNEGKALARRLIDLGANVVFHCGPLVKKDENEWKILGMVPMPSWLVGFERISKAVNLLNLRLIIGKGSLFALSDFLTESKCVHAVCEGNFNDYGLKVKKVIEGHWLDLGIPEALWVLEAEEMGPFIVETDATGGSLYKKLDEAFKLETRSLLDKFGIKLD